MIGGLKPYPEMRPSGLPWLGDVPAHWEVSRIKTLLTEIDSRSQHGRERLLSLRMRHGLVDHLLAGGKPIPPENLIGFKNIEVGQIVMNRMRAAYGLFGIARSEGLVSPDYAVFAVRKGVHAQYFVETFKMPQLGQIFRSESKGLGTGEAGFLRLYTDRFGPISVPYPPLEEQRLIMRFLNWHGTQTAKLLHTKKKLISFLNEKKRAIIHRFVTTGLNDHVSTRNTCIPWVSNVPEHWGISRIKTEFQCLNHRRVPLSSTQRGEMTIRNYEYYGASGVIDKVDDYLFDDRLLLIAEDGANLVLRNLPLAIIAEGKFWVNNHAHILKPRRGDIRFLAAVLEGLDFLPWISGAAQPKLTQDRLMSISIAVPPEQEQRAIMDCCEASTVTLSRAMAEAKEEVTLIQEFRTRLVADVITGKLDVRAAAASLPALAEAEPADALADEDNSDEAADAFEDEEVAA